MKKLLLSFITLVNFHNIYSTYNIKNLYNIIAKSSRNFHTTNRFLTLKNHYPSVKPEITCALIKPEIVKNNPKAIEEILKEIEYNGFEILSKKFKHLTPDEAKWFYQNLKHKPFFHEVIDYITSGPIIALAIRKPNAIDIWRKTIGNTDPKLAFHGTIRQRLGIDREKNAVHGSDSLEAAQFELRTLFPELAPILYNPNTLIESSSLVTKEQV